MIYYFHKKKIVRMKFNKGINFISDLNYEMAENIGEFTEQMIIDKLSKIPQ